MEDELMRARLMEQARSFWLDPEIARRSADGKLAEDFLLVSFTVILGPDGGCTVLLNEEARFAILADWPSGLEPDQEIESEKLNVRGFFPVDLPPNTGFVSGVMVNGQWSVTFDFRYNESHAKERAAAAKQFLESAQADLEAKRYRPLVENLFHCFEHLSKSLLMTSTNTSILKSVKHDDVRKALREQAKRGNVPIEFSKALDRLDQLRKPAVYLDCEFKVQPHELRKLIDTTVRLAEYANEALPIRATSRPA